MPRQSYVRHTDDVDHIKNCTLCRTDRLAKVILARAQSRNVYWPRQPTAPRFEDVGARTVSLEEAFSVMVNFMKVSCDMCKKFYRCPRHVGCYGDANHCSRFHHNRATIAKSENTASRAPSQRDSLQVVANPGSYSITAGAWGKPSKQQTHVVRLLRGQEVNVDFTL